MLISYLINISVSNGTRNTRNTRQRTDTTVPLSVVVNGSNQATSSEVATESPNMANVLAAGQKSVASVAADGTAVRENVQRMKMSRNWKQWPRKTAGSDATIALRLWS
jgi:type IV secretory pathway TrbL component